MLVQAHTMMNSYIKKPRHRSVSGLLGTFIPYCLVMLLTLIVKADGQGLMQKGIQIPAQTKRDLTEALQPLETAVDFIQQSEDPFLQAYAPDVLIYLKAVKDALEHNEFHRENQFDVAERLIVHGLERAALLMNGKAPWTRQTGLVVRGYRSHLDDSVQPYGLVVPSSWQAGKAASHRMDVWLHGRDNSLTELKFIDQRERSPGQFTPEHTFVIHPYGRFCNAFKFAGEVDVIEAMAHVKEQYQIDEDRVSIRGFSMGGAGCWHLAVHYADQWAAAAPGAGFSESADYLGLWKKEIKPTWYETKLWRLYDADEYALNLFHLPTVAYSGGADKQIQAARMMERALEREGMKLAHVIGPDTGHRYHPEAKKEVERRVDQLASIGRQRVPKKVKMTTYTLKYPNMHWVQLDGLQKHWEKAEVTAEIHEGATVKVQTQNVSGLTLSMEAGECPLDSGVTPMVFIDGQELAVDRVKTDLSWDVSLVKQDGVWKNVAAGNTGVMLRKKPGLQGPIDDVFMDRFVIVKPSGQVRRSLSDRWIRRELVRLEDQWREQFRGEALAVSDLDFKLDEWKDANWVLFGSPETNALIKQLAPYLPVQWRSGSIRVGEQVFDDTRHVPVLIFPNPMNPEKYVVLNSGFTFRGFGSNATQVPRLPDYAIIDTRVRATTESPGEIVLTGFFDEQWQLSR